MQVAVPRVVGAQPRLDRGAVHAVGLHVAVRDALELAADGVHRRRDEPAHAPRHDDERKPVLVHEPDVVMAEVAAVQDEAHVVVAVALGLREHELQLAHVHDAAGVLLVEEWLAVPLVVCYGVVEDAVQREVQPGLGEHPAREQERLYPQAAADAAADRVVGQRDLRQVLAEVLVGDEPARFRVELADGDPFRQGVAPFRVVFAAVFVVDVDRTPDRPHRYQPGEVGNVPVKAVFMDFSKFLRISS